MKGFLRKDGRKGIRNVIVVAYLVECAHHVARQIVTDFSGEDVHLIGFSGCAPNDYVQKMMENICTHPNVGAVLLVSLGCENFNRNKLSKHILTSGRFVEKLVIQDHGGTLSSVEKGKSILETFKSQLKTVERVDFKISDLMVGTICGGSDATSGFTANPSIGKAFDTLVAEGATCIFEEPGELLGCEHLMAQRAENKQVGVQLVDCIKKANNYYKAMGHDSFSAGNAVGGLTTIEEKSLGAYSKSGSLPIKALIKPGEIPEESGLYFMDVVPDGEALWGFPNINDNSEIVEMIASGCHIILFSTGRGSVVGSAVSPVIKVCGNPKTFENLSGDMDINSGKIISNGASLEALGAEIIALIKKVIQGKKTKSEQLGHQEFSLGYKYFHYGKKNCEM
ncbi:hydrolase [Seonamhaeicola sp. S2-3]|uniref:UxaA family hydrolase n=1 Tax=Seonamhaeicola sp. S2-3 TaxID=1936081 RepID=UPI000972DF91|nr:UxaA family hydrolase [Seonamhaeicola sp. S2-3]APY11622.1 hydrolase [Seonamhaeicola sp. S2-3]